MHTRTSNLTRATLVAVALSICAASPAAAATSSPAQPAGSVLSQAAAALAKLKGMTISEARSQLSREKAEAEMGVRIEKTLAGRTGGSFLDANGEVVVTTLDAAGKAKVTGNGADAKVVDDSTARLDSIMQAFDRQAAAQGPGKSQGWRVDVPTNTVVMTVTDGASDPTTDAMLQLAATFGTSVRIERKAAVQAPQVAEWMVGGFQFQPASGGPCSVGFNTVDASNRAVVLTAGHCVMSGMNSRNGFNIGASRTSNYPGDDFGTFWNSYPGYWQPSPSVYRYDNNTYMRLAGSWNAPPIGATVCKSGRTTGFTCGTITAVNQTVVYSGRYTVSGLTRHNACVEGGDSGGANVSAGGYALGMTSGASMNAGRCLSKLGSANVSWYQPIGEALTANGLRLVL